MIQQWDYRRACKVMGFCVLCSSVLSFFVSIKGHAGFFFGIDAPEVIEGKRQSSSSEDKKISVPTDHTELCLNKNPIVHDQGGEK